MPKENIQRIDLSAKKIVAGWPKVGYNQSDDRIRSFYTKYAGATRDMHSMFAGKRLADIFIYSMVLGKHAGITEDYAKKSDRKDSIDIEYIAQRPEYIWMMLAIAVEEAWENKTDPLSTFENPRERILDVCERYANYGVRILMDMESRATTADPLTGYEKKFVEALTESND